MYRTDESVINRQETLRQKVAYSQDSNSRTLEQFMLFPYAQLSLLKIEDRYSKRKKYNLYIGKGNVQ